MIDPVHMCQVSHTVLIFRNDLLSNELLDKSLDKFLDFWTSGLLDFGTSLWTNGTGQLHRNSENERLIGSQKLSNYDRHVMHTSVSQIVA